MKYRYAYVSYLYKGKKVASSKQEKHQENTSFYPNLYHCEYIIIIYSHGWRGRGKRNKRL